MTVLKALHVLLQLLLLPCAVAVVAMRACLHLLRGRRSCFSLEGHVIGQGLVATPSRGGKAVTVILFATHHLRLQTGKNQKEKPETEPTVPGSPWNSWCSILYTSSQTMNTD